MAMDDSLICSDCGSPVPGDAPLEVCPRCSLRAALVGELVEEPNAAKEEAAVPPIALEIQDDGAATPRTQRFGDYELLEEIARGGMGIVYRARQISLDRIVAVKLLPFGSLTSAQFIKRFRAEASAAAALRHPNIVTVHEVGVHQGQHYLVMNFVNGPPLSRLVADGPLDAGRAASCVKRVAEAVHYAHEKGILHRDLKPSNVLVEADDQPLVTDFGLAKRLDGESSLTVTGQALGSPGYMPPEQALAEHSKVTRRSDVYGLGAMLYHLLTGRPPFQANTLNLAIQQVSEHEPVAPVLLNPNLPQDIQTICLKCLEKEPERRYATARELADELGRFLHGEPIRARPIGSVGRTWRWCRRRPLLASLSLGLIVTFFAGLGGILWQWNRAVANEWLARQNAYAADIKLAQQSLEQGDFGTALDLLNKHRPESPDQDLRGWEWRYLWSLCQSDEQDTLVRYPSWVGSVSVSSDGSTLAVQRNDRITLWDLSSRREITNLIASGFQGSAAFAPAGSLLAVANSTDEGNAEVLLWDLRDLSAKTSLPHEAPVISLAFSQHGDFLATKDNRNTVHVWAIGSNNRLVHSIGARGSTPTPGEAIPSAGIIQFSPDSTLLAFQKDPSTLRVIDWRNETDIPITTPSRDPSMNDPMMYYITSMAVSPTGLLAWGLANGTIHLWDMVEQQKVGEILGHTDSVLALKFSPDGQYLASTGGDQSIRVWNPTNQQELGQLRGHEDDVWSLDFVDHTTLVSGGKDGSVRLWDVTQGGAASTVIDSMAVGTASPHRVVPVFMPRFTQDGRHIIVLKTQEDSVERRDAQTFERIESLPEFGDNIWSMNLSSDDRWFVVVRRGESQAGVWDWQTRQLVTNLVTTARALGVGFSPDSKHIFVRYSLPQSAIRGLGSAQTYKIWQTGSWEEIPTDWIEPSMRGGNISPDSRMVVFGHATGEIKLYSFPDGRLLGSFGSYPSRVGDLQFSPDGRILASTSDDGHVRLWDVRSRKRLAELRSRFIQMAVAFSPDGKRLAIGNFGGGIQGPHVRLWDLTTRRELLMLSGAAIRTGFSPDGNLLYAREQPFGDYVMRLWRAPSWEEIAAIESPAIRH